MLNILVCTCPVAGNYQKSHYKLVQRIHNGPMSAILLL